MGRELVSLELDLPPFPDTLLLGTTNAGKVAELTRLLAGLPLTLVLPADVGLGDYDPPEDADTLDANARQKALLWAERSGLCALADDSGLFVDALDGAPGVYSARYAPDAASRRARLLDALRDVPPDARGAHFACVIAVAVPGQVVFTSMGRVDGHIAPAESSGTHGFGYDPLFVPEGHTVTLADLPPDAKSALSHRGRAAAQAVAAFNLWHAGKGLA